MESKKCEQTEIDGENGGVVGQRLRQVSHVRRLHTCTDLGVSLKTLPHLKEELGELVL